MRKYILYSTLFAIFSGRFLFIISGTSILYFYFLVVINLVILAAKEWLWIPEKLLAVLAYLAVSGIFGLFTGTNSLQGFLKEFIGILICSLYCLAFMRFMKFDVHTCFALYAKLAFYMSIIGIVYLPFQDYPVDRLKGLAIEPAAFAVVCIPAVFYYADEWQRNRRYGWRFITVMLAMILTVSAAGFLGLFLALLLFGLRYKYARSFVIVLVAVLGVFTYSLSSEFRLRLNDSVSSLAVQDVSGIDASAFGVVSNIFVTEKAFAAHPLIGGGLGSYSVTHGRYIDMVPGAAYASEVFTSLGTTEANSLFLRVTAEMGLIGLIYFTWLIVYFWPHGGTAEERALAMSFMCYLFLKCLRSGGYFGPEQFFFITLYAVNGLMVRNRKRAARMPEALTAEIHPIGI